MKDTVCFLATILLLVCASCLATYSYLQDHTITLQKLEQRVFEQYGAGDAGIEQMLYLTTGQHIDFMGQPKQPEPPKFTAGYDYCINITDSGTQIYTLSGKFIDFVPFDSTSQFDRAILADNL